MELNVRVQPRAPRDEVAGWRAGRLIVRVTAPPVDDRANLAVCRLLAKRCGVPRSAVAIVAGERSRDKRIAVAGLAAVPDWAVDPASR